jgi:hypothetical protein
MEPVTEIPYDQMVGGTRLLADARYKVQGDAGRNPLPTPRSGRNYSVLLLRELIHSFQTNMTTHGQREKFRACLTLLFPCLSG